MQSSARTWIVVATAALSVFISFLDTTVTNSSLPQIQGEIGASGTEGTWIGTSYLAAETVMIPLTAWLSRMLGVRLFLIGSIVAFTGFSAVCGLSSSLPQMILGRVGQGFAGGALIPLGLTIIATSLPPERQTLGIGIFATTSVLAPAIGAPLGGWLTDSLGWSWIFFINLPIGLMLIAAALYGIDKSPIKASEFIRADWVGIIGLALSLGCLIVILEEGQRKNWFESLEICVLAIFSCMGAVFVAASQIWSKNPVLKIRLLKKPSMAAVVVCGMAMGFGFFASFYLPTVFLSYVAGYDAMQTGSINMYYGVTATLIMPFLAFAMTRLDIRILIIGGFLVTGAAELLNTHLTAETGGAPFILFLLIIGASTMVPALPLTQAATTALAAEDVPDGSALFSVGRNLGGSVGLALCGVSLDRRQAFHQGHIESAVTGNSLIGQDRLQQMQNVLVEQGVDPVHAHLQALRMLQLAIEKEALVLAFSDTFWLLALLLFAVTPIALFIRGDIPKSGSQLAH
ncbi:MAG: DHA2 family efflux MFS transporter permease subunit [Caulobacterales bacterium]